MTWEQQLGDHGRTIDAAFSDDTAKIIALQNENIRLENENLRLQEIIDTPPVVTPPPVTGVRKIRYRPPTLTSPITITLTATSRKADLGPNQDAIVKIGKVIDCPSGLEILGGRNITVIGGEIGFTKTMIVAGTTDLGRTNRALYIKAKAGTTSRRHVHIEGLKITGTPIGEGIDWDEASMPSTLTLANVYISGSLVGTQATNHSDAFQPWNGPEKLQIDGFVADNLQYQGFMLQPLKFGSHVLDDPWGEFHNIHLVQNEAGSGYALWWTAGKMVGSNVAVRLNAKWAAHADKGLWKPSNWPFVTTYTGTPKPLSEFLSGTPGVDYISPGYL